MVYMVMIPTSVREVSREGMLHKSQLIVTQGASRVDQSGDFMYDPIYASGPTSATRYTSISQFQDSETFGIESSICLGKRNRGIVHAFV